MSIRARRTLIAFCCITWLATAIYWILFFGFNQVQVKETAVYLGYERAFPVGDFWLIILSLIATIQLARRHNSAGKWLLATGAVLVYLGCLDTLFDVEQQVYNVLSSQAWEEIVINLYSFIFGVFCIVFGFRHDRFTVRAKIPDSVNHTM